MIRENPSREDSRQNSRHLVIESSMLKMLVEALAAARNCIPVLRAIRTLAVSTVMAGRAHTAPLGAAVVAGPGFENSRRRHIDRITVKTCSQWK